MAYKSILVHLKGHARDSQTLDVACNIRRRFGAQLTAIFAPDQAATPMVATAVDSAAIAATRLRIEYDFKLQENAKLMIETAERRDGINITWRAINDDAMNSIIMHARMADLVVLTQEDPSKRLLIAPSVVANVVLSAGHPVLIVPYVGQFSTCGESVLVAWSGTRESARAVSDAVPLIKGARAVHLVSFNNATDENGGAQSDIDVGQWLSRHDLKVTCRRQTSKDIDVGNQILSLAADLESDMVVMGGYGHSRTIEFFLGGVTKTLLDTMTVPVLMSH